MSLMPQCLYLPSDQVPLMSQESDDRGEFLDLTGKEHEFDACVVHYLYLLLFVVLLFEDGHG